MKRITYASRIGFAAMGLAVLLSSAFLANGTGANGFLPDHDGRRGDYEPAAAALERGEADLDEGGERALRRARTSAMPYFSFAQSLRPRG